MSGAQFGFYYAKIKDAREKAGGADVEKNEEKRLKRAEGDEKKKGVSAERNEKQGKIGMKRRSRFRGV